MSKAVPVFKPYPEKLVPLNMSLPGKAMATLDQIARHRKKSCEYLILEYLSAGMRSDLSDLFRETAMRTVHEVVGRRLPEAEAQAILKEIHDELRPAHLRDEFKPKRPPTDAPPVVEES